MSNTEPKKDYLVVLEYTRAAGPHAGVRTINIFDSKEQFDPCFSEEARKFEKVIGEGVDENKAQLLLRGMSIGGLVRANLHEAQRCSGGESGVRSAKLAALTTAMALRGLGL